MRLHYPMLMLVSSLVLSGCIDSLRSPQPPSTWATGFWYWHGNGAEAAQAKATPDVLFVHVGTIWKSTGPLFARRGTNGPVEWGVSGEWPDSMPVAREYWLVFRQESAGVPDTPVAPMLAERISQLLNTARSWKLKIAGIQLDIDCPTGSLSQYADFLRETRKHLPAHVEISITALLDWFREGTSIAGVIRETDEFVPQFYDVASTAQRGRPDDWHSIAAKIDAARWGPRFNRFGKRFRIGIATFGRARYVPRPDPDHNAYFGLMLYSDLTPVDIASNSAFDLQTSHSEAGELILSYRPTRKVRVGYNDFEPGGLIQFVLSTPESVKAATDAARRIGGRCAGVLFFRWPATNENLVMDPDDALIAAGLAKPEQKVVSVEAANGHCAAVTCVDLYLLNTDPLLSRTTRYLIRSSAELEYFLPEQRVPARLAGAAEIEMTLPPYCGRRRILLGRAVSAARAEFRIEGER